MPCGRIEFFGSLGEGDGKESLKLFASLGESFFYKSIKVSEIMRDGGTRGKAQDGGLDLGARIKDFGGKGTNFFEKKNSLEENGDGAVLGGAGEGDKAVGDFFLESDDDRFRGWSTEGELDEEWGGDGVGKISADEGAGWMLGEGLKSIAFDELEAGFVLEGLAKPGDETLVDFERFDGVACGEEGAGEGAEAWADFLDGFGFGWGESGGDDGGEGGFDEKVLAELAQGAQAVGGQDFADLGRIQSWRLRMAWSSPGLRMP